MDAKANTREAIDEIEIDAHSLKFLERAELNEELSRIDLKEYPEDQFEKVKLESQGTPFDKATISKENLEDKDLEESPEEQDFRVERRRQCWTSCQKSFQRNL